MTSFEDFIEELRAEAEREGLEALAEFDLFESYFRELAGIVAGLRAVQRGEMHERSSRRRSARRTSHGWV